jgi:hypothetical protein
MVYLGLYHHQLASSFETEENRDLVSVALTSSLTGALAWIVCYPFDTAKTLLQSGRTVDTVTALWQSKGIRGFYKGCGSSTGRAMLVTSSRMIAYEWSLGVMRHD